MSIDFDNYKAGGLLKDRYLKIEDISEGAYGIVSLAEDTFNDKKLVAVKYITQFTGEDDKNSDGKGVTPLKANELDVSKSGSVKEKETRLPEKVLDRTTVLAEAKQEIDILTKLGSHPHISELYDSFDSYLILEFCSRGDLYEIIRSNCGPTSTKDIVDVMNQLIDAVGYAHSLGIYHRDIKPENILITEDWSVKLTDWGLATDKNDCTDFDVGSERYMAPELFDRKNIESYEASKCDIWSLGICLLNLVFGKNPFTVANQSDKLFVHFAANRETLFDIFPTMSYELFGVLRYSLTIDPDNRNLENMRQELSKVRHMTLDYDLESFASETEAIPTQETEERSKSNPVGTNSPERKFVVRRDRKPLAIPSKKYTYGENNNHKNNNNSYYHNNNNYNNNNNNSNSYQNNNNHNSFSYNRQDFFTPRSVFNKYMDKIDRNHNELKDLDNNIQRNTRTTYYKKRIPNKRGWRKSNKKPTPRNIGNNDGFFLKPMSIKKTSPPPQPQYSSSQLISRKRYSNTSYSSSVGKYVPPSLRSPNLEPQLKKVEDTIDSSVFFDDDDDDDLFMLEEYQNSPKNGDVGRNNNVLSFNYPDSSKSIGNKSSSKKLQQVTNTIPSSVEEVLLPVPMTSSISAHAGQSAAEVTHGEKYVPPHHRRNSHSAVMNQKRKFVSRAGGVVNNNNRQSLISNNSDLESSSVPVSSWSLKNEKLNKINYRFDKNYNQNGFNVNDMYHTFAKLDLSNSGDNGAGDSNDNNTKTSSNTPFFSSDDEENESDYNNNNNSLGNRHFKFATRAIPSYTG